MQELKILVLVIGAGMISSAIFRAAFGRFDQQIPLIFTWILLIASALFLKTIWAVFALILFIKLIYLKNDAEKSIIFFIALLPVFPENNFFPFFRPGTLYIVNLSTQLVLSLIFLLPLVPRLMREERSEYRRMDIAFVLIMVIFMVGAFRERSGFQITVFAAIRDNITTFFTILLPYYVVTRSVRSIDQMRNIFKGLVVTGLFIVVFSYIEAVWKWKIFIDIAQYLNASGMAGINQFYEIRHGLLRVSVSLVHPITLGFYLTIILGVITFLTKTEKTKGIVAAGVFLLACGSVYLTVSRGAMIGLALMLLVYLAFKLSLGARRFVLVATTLSILVTAFVMLNPAIYKTKASLADVDEFGTFEYRLKLAQTGVKIIPKNFLFGSRVYKSDPEMQALVQGQGIIDMVNGYVHIALEFGMVALMLLLFLLARAVRTGFGWFALGDETDNSMYKHLGVMLVAVIIALAAQFIFVSYGGFVAIYLFLAIGLARNLAIIKSETEPESPGEDLHYSESYTSV